jgi:membrane protease YdiL (CAAX protease family)
MISKLGRDYIGVTFAIALPCWGLLAILGAAGILLSEQDALYVLFLLGGLSPTISSYFVLKKHGQIGGLRDWLKGVFDLKRPVAAYLMVLLFVGLYFIPQGIISGFAQGTPWFLLPALIPAMLQPGALEEAGWRHILQPELERKFRFVKATLITAFIWALWHLPLFLIPTGIAQSGMDYGLFCVGVLGMNFALAAIKRVTGSTGLCVLLHYMVNALSTVLIMNENPIGIVTASALMIAVSLILVRRAKH